MNLNAILAAIGAHNYLMLVMLGAVYARALFSNKSRFPWSWAPNWLPLFSGLAGAVITVDAAMQGGSTLTAALPAGFLGLVGGGFFDGLVAAIFGSPANAPMWAKFIVGIIDDVSGGGGGGGASANLKTPAVNVPAPKPPTSSRIRGLVAAAGLLVIVCIVPACKGPVIPTILDVVQVVENDLKAGDSPPQIDSDVCAALGGSALTDAICGGVTVLVEDVITLLMDGGALKSNPKAMAAAAAYHTAHATVSK